MTYSVNRLSFGNAGPRCAVKAAAIAVEILRGTPHDAEPVIRHLLRGINSPFAFARVDGEKGWNMKKWAHWWSTTRTISRTRNYCRFFVCISV